MVVEGAATAASASGTICGFLDDGGGAGSAASLPPNATPTSGLGFEQVNVGAWGLCYDPNTAHLTLYAYQGYWCMADDSGTAKLRLCNGNTDQQWYGVSLAGIDSFQAKNDNGGYLCADGGVGSADKVVPLSDCSTYHSTWRWEPSP